MPNFIDKIIFINKLSEEEYINHCGKASVLLDPLYFGAGNSFHESMFYGTPTITLPTNFLRSKIVEGAYKQLEIKDAPVVKNVDDYVSSAVEIANLNPKKTLEIKKYYAECLIKIYLKIKMHFQSFQKINRLKKIKTFIYLRFFFLLFQIPLLLKHHHYKAYLVY